MLAFWITYVFHEVSQRLIFNNDEIGNAITPSEKKVAKEASAVVIVKYFNC